ncbi:MAG: hypothetical protein ACJ748_11340, partial [Flavisolibacter sp.]
MAIIIQKRPYQYCFSGNPVHYELYSDLAAGDPTVSFEIRLMFKNIGGVYAVTPALPYDPVEGIATIDAQDILDGLLEYELPQFDVDEKTIWPAAGHSGQFYLQYREITTANPDPSWDDSELDYERIVVKAGLSRFKYQGNNFWVNYFNTTALHPFLTWQKRSRLAALTERMYLLYFNITAASGIKAVAKATYTDGSNLSVEKDFPSADNNVCYYIPAGATQWGLIDAVKTLYYWEISIVDITNVAVPVTISESFRYYADNRNDYNDLTL